MIGCNSTQDIMPCRSGVTSYWFLILCKVNVIKRYELFTLGC